MPCDEDGLLRSAQAAMSRGAWDEARAAFEAVLERDREPEALAGLGKALWWLGEPGAAVRWQEQAYAEFRRRREPERAARVAVRLCLVYRASLGNDAVSQGWLGRLTRLVDDFDLDTVRGWVALCRAVVADDGGDPASGERWARTAVDAAARADDIDLVLCALAELGNALTEQDRVTEGAALLDEAMVGALGGEALLPESVVFVASRTIVCCSRAGDVERAVQWIKAGEGLGRRFGELHLYAVCRVHYGGLMFGSGRWAEAEAAYRSVLRLGDDAEPWLRAGALGGLADLRLAQGRQAEAAGLVAGYEAHPGVGSVLAALHLARGQPLVAVALLHGRTATDGLPRPGPRRLESARVAELLAEAELASGDVDRAVETARALAQDGQRLGCESVSARGWRALGRAVAARGDSEAAVGCLQRALDGFGRLGMPYEAGRTCLALATVLRAERPEAAVAWARVALSTCSRLGAAADADAAAALLRSLGVRASRGGASEEGPLTRREREVLVLLADGLSNRELAERLVLSRKTVEHHVANLLAKLGLAGRAEAVAYALRHPETARPDPPPLPTGMTAGQGRIS